MKKIDVNKNEIVACLVEHPKRDDRKISFITISNGTCEMKKFRNVNFASKEAIQMFEIYPTLFTFVMRKIPHVYVSDYKQSLKWYDFLGKAELRKFEQSMNDADTRDLFPLCEEEDVCVEKQTGVLFIKNKLYTPFCSFWNNKDDAFKKGIHSRSEKIRIVTEELCKEIGIENVSDLDRIKTGLPTNDVVFHGLEW